MPYIGENEVRTSFFTESLISPEDYLKSQAINLFSQ